MAQEGIARQTMVYSVEATAYTLFDEDCTGIAFDGNPAVPFETIAVDPDVIPLGSRVFVPSMGWFTAHDTGGAIQEMKIDVCVDSTETAFSWGRQQINIIVITP
jgi:3D (Asp-Asp-Asp) domain-containing protein